jgi:hypothetical protein
MLMVGVAAVGLVSLPAVASAQGDSAKRQKVVFTPTDVVSEGVGDPVCDAAGQCAFFVKVTANETGDLVGTVVQGIVYSFNTSNRAPFSASGAFTGSVKGCGSGGFLYTGRGVVDPATGDGPVEFPIVEGSGTGDLVGISGVFRGRDDGSFGGWVRCPGGK